MNPTCARPGNIQYVICNVCGMYLDTNGVELEENAWVLPAINHANKTLTEASPASCGSAGNTVYYTCPDCGKDFDVDGNEIEKDSWVIPMKSVHHAVDGICSECGKNFLKTLTYAAKLPADLTRIEDEAFTGISAQSIVVPDGCTAIGSRAFADCASLRYVFLPAALEGNLPDNVFEGCSTSIQLIYQ